MQTLRNQKARTQAERQALKDIDNIARQADEERIRTAERLAKRVEKGEVNDELFPLMERDLDTLGRMVTRMEGVAGRAAARVTRTRGGTVITRGRLSQLRDEMTELRPTWEQELLRAKRVRPGEGIIDLPGLQGRVFPETLARAMNKVLREEGARRGPQAGALDTLESVNVLYRGLNATLDNSGPGIQGLLALYANPRAWARALKVSVKAWADEDVLGSFIAQYDETALQLRLPNSADAARDGLRIGGVESEFQLGRTGAYEMVKRTPVVGAGIRKADRAFGFQGDSLRLKWYRDMVEDEVARGTTVQQLRASGDMERIASVANRMTGWSEKRAFGSVGDLLFFAPRFLMSRLETVTLASRGMLPGAPMDARQARRSIVKMLAWGTTATISINYLLGNETDFRPIKNGRYNSNFMRIRYKGRNWSVFGTWDSLLRAMVSVGLGQAPDVLRGMGSGIVSNAWDLISEEDYLGNRIDRDDPLALSLHVLQQFIPFAWEEIPTAIRQGARGEVLGAGTTLVGEVFGLKSYPLSVPVLGRDKFIDGLNLTNLTGESIHEWSEVNRATQKNLLRKYPELFEFDKAMKEDRFSRSNDIERARITGADKNRTDFHEEMLKAYDYAGVSRLRYDKERTRIRTFYGGRRSQLFDTRTALEADSVQALEQWIGTNQLPEDAAMNAYWIRKEELIEEEVKPERDQGDAWRAVDIGLESFLREYPLEIQRYVKENRDSWILDLPEPVRSLEQQRVKEMDSGQWFKLYNQPALPGGARIIYSNRPIYMEPTPQPQPQTIYSSRPQPTQPR